MAKISKKMAKIAVFWKIYGQKYKILQLPQNVPMAVYFLPKKSGFANKASFAPKQLTISTINSKLHCTTCLSLS